VRSSEAIEASITLVKLEGSSLLSLYSLFMFKAVNTSSLI
jgi:hypothetical protein